MRLHLVNIIHINIIYALSVLLLASCSKTFPADDASATLDFAVSLDRQILTRTGDGQGTSVNRCILELYYNDQFYIRSVVAYSAEGARFLNIPVVPDKTYKALFWADCGNDGLTDKYYNTGISGLKQVEIITTDYSGNNDERDAFCACVDVSVSRQSESSPTAVTLKRPFAQINIVATDENVSDGNYPSEVSLSYTAPKGINVESGELLESAAFSYTADVFSEFNPGNSKLAMDYIFASGNSDQNIDIEFSTVPANGPSNIHTLHNIPYRRGYRTNVRGEFLTDASAVSLSVHPNISPYEESLNSEYNISDLLLSNY